MLRMIGRLIAAVGGITILRNYRAINSASTTNEPHLELTFLLVVRLAVEQLPDLWMLKVACCWLIPPAHVFISQEDDDEKF